MDERKIYIPGAMPSLFERTFPNAVIDNWDAAFKIRRHYEEVTMKRIAQGKKVY